MEVECLLELMNLILHPRLKFHWIWTEPRSILGNMLDMTTTVTCPWKAMKICKDLVYFVFWIIIVGIGKSSF